MTWKVRAGCGRRQTANRQHWPAVSLGRPQFDGESIRGILACRQRHPSQVDRIHYSSVLMAASDAIVAARGLLTALQAATAGFDKASSADVDLSKAQADLRKLRMHMTEFPGLPPSAGTDEASREQQVIARAALEQACLIAVRAGDGAALERAWAQLVPYYGDLA